MALCCALWKILPWFETFSYHALLTIASKKVSATVTEQFLCELCFDALTPHRTAAWDGLEMAVCVDCLAPPATHPCWDTVGESYGVAEVVGDGRGEGYLVRLKNGATIHFRWDKPLRPRRTES